MNQPRPFNSLTTEEKWDRIRAYRAQDITYTDDMKDFMVDKEEPKPVVRAPPPKKGGRLGLYVKRRGTKRHGRSRKHRKLRKLTSRRR